MIDVFTEEIEIMIKTGMSHLYWYISDLEKCWLRSGVPETICSKIKLLRNSEGKRLTKREMMDKLYLELRKLNYNRRLEISRHFVSVLVGHKNFVPQNEKHRIETAERYALKIREIIQQQKKDYDQRASTAGHLHTIKPDYYTLLSKLNKEFLEAIKLSPQKRGYAFESLFNTLMKISDIPVEKPFKIVGEQIDGAIKYDSHYYLIELKWINKQSAHNDIASLYMKVEGKMEARGLFISMEGFSKEILESLPKGKSIKVMLFDGVHICNVLSSNYTFKELLDYAIKQATLKAVLFCSYDLR